MARTSAPISPEWLYEQYLAGKVIDNQALYAANPDEVHFAVALELGDEAAPGAFR